MPPLIEVEGASISGGASSRLIVEELSFDTRTDTRLALMGASGTGKTSVLRALAGQVSPSAGTVLIAGEAATRRSSDVAYLPQQGGVFPWLRVREHLQLSKRWDSRYAGELVQRLKLSAALNTYAAHLSGGEKKRLALCLCLLTSTHILLLDEPTVGMDADIRLEAIRLIQEKQRRGDVTTVVVTHHADEAATLADQVLFLAGTPSHIVLNLILEPSTTAPDRNLQVQDSLMKVLTKFS